MAYEFCDYYAERSIEYRKDIVVKTVKSSSKEYADTLEYCFENLDRSKFKTDIIEFFYERKNNTFKIYMNRVYEKCETLSEKEILQLYYDFIKSCDEGHPIHYDCALNNCWRIDGKLILIDVDSLCVKPNKEELNSVFWFRLAERIGYHVLDIHKKVSRLLINMDEFPYFKGKESEINLIRYLNGKDKS